MITEPNKTNHPLLGERAGVRAGKKSKQRRTLADVRREMIARRIHAFFAWRAALSRFWRIDLLWRAIKLRWVYARRERVLGVLLKNKMSPDWRDSRPKKLQRKLGILRQVEQASGLSQPASGRLPHEHACSTP
jgi:hypothetical protein